MKQIDARTWKCPQPVVEARKALLAAPGEALCVLVADETGRQNLRRLAEGLGYAVSETPADHGYALELTPGSATAAATTAALARGKTVVLVGAETMGSGSDELGRVLLRNFLITLAEMTPPPEAIYFVNAGVKLTVQGADTVEILEKLACNGSDIAACGLCLDFFHLKEQLAVGRVTNMLDIAETLLQAGRVIHP